MSSRPSNQPQVQAKPDLQKIGQKPEENVNWGHLLKLQQDIQNTKEDYEKAMKHHERNLYKEELDKMLELDMNKKAMEKLKDETVRKRIEENNREIAEREKMTSYARRQLQTDFYKFGLENAQARNEFLRGLKAEEREYYLSQWKREEEARRIKDIKEAEFKKHQTEELIDAYTKNITAQHENKLKEKIEDKIYMEQKIHQSSFAAQDVLRKELLDRIKNGFSGNESVKDLYARAYEQKRVDMANFDKNIVEKAAIEKMIRDEQRWKTMEEVKHKGEVDTFSRNQKLMHDKTNEKLQKKYDEMVTEHEVNQRKLAEYQRQLQIEEELKRQQKEANKAALEAQIREKQIRLLEEGKLRPHESGMNREHINIIKNNQDTKYFDAIQKTASVPGLTFDHHRKRQHDYITKSLIFENKLMAPNDNGRTMFEERYGKKQEGVIYGDLSHRSRGSNQENVNVQNMTHSSQLNIPEIKGNSDRGVPIIHYREGNQSISLTHNRKPSEIGQNDYWDPRTMQQLDGQMKTVGSTSQIPAEFASPNHARVEYMRLKKLHNGRDFNIINNNLKQ